MQKYKISFDPWGLLLFLLIMLPNCIWFILPAPQDILRRESVTPVLDGIASVCQFLLVVSLCFIVNRTREKLRCTPSIFAAIVCILLYVLGWGFYYAGFANLPVIALLTVPPCLSFFFFSLDRKNYIAVLPIAVFTVCHLIYSIANFII